MRYNIIANDLFDEGMSSILDTTIEEIHPSLGAYLRAGFIEHDGHFVFRTLSRRLEETDPSLFEDAARYEYFINKVHVDEYLRIIDFDTGKIAFLQGIVFAHKTFKQLHQSFPENKFQVIVSYGVAHEIPSVSVSFFALWPNTLPMLDSDLEQYKDEALVVFE